MNYGFNLKGRKVTVMGLGLHGGGVGVVNWLTKQGANVLVTDVRSKKVLAPSVKQLRSKKITFVFGRHRVRDFTRADLIIKNPGVPRDSRYLAAVRRQGIPIETDISLFFQLCPAPIIGITGTKGKSTTTVLLYEFLKKAGQKPIMAGNIRISPLQFLLKIKKTTPVVLELSSWQLEDMAHLKVSPHIAVIKNILPDHLNRYRSMADYAEAKKIILQYQQREDVAVLNHANQITRSLGSQAIGQRFWFSIKQFSEQNGCFVRSKHVVFRRNGRVEKICRTAEVRMSGLHNLENVLAAVTVAKLRGVSNQTIRTVLRRFHGLADRLELIRKWQQREFYNDTTATAPAATVAALHCFNKKVILLAGGSDKRLSYRELAREIKKKVSFVALFRGSATVQMVRELKKMRYRAYRLVGSMREAVAVAYQKSSPNSVILLSPGAASFGMFLNEFDRGEQFKKIVRQLA